MEELEKKLGYTFRDPELLRAALYHSSYANEHRSEGIRSNERLEFLGDSILGFVVADYLYRIFPGKPEGELTRIRALLVLGCGRVLGEQILRRDKPEHTVAQKFQSFIAEKVRAAMLVGI